jgi:hypothetical protein
LPRFLFYDMVNLKGSSFSGKVNMLGKPWPCRWLRPTSETFSVVAIPSTLKPSRFFLRGFL